MFKKAGFPDNVVTVANGGKDPMIVFADTHMGRAVKGACGALLQTVVKCV